MAFVIAKASSALEKDANSTVYKNLFIDLLRKPPYKLKPDVSTGKSQKILVLSTWSAGIIKKYILSQLFVRCMILS